MVKKTTYSNRNNRKRNNDPCQKQKQILNTKIEKSNSIKTTSFVRLIYNSLRDLFNTTKEQQLLNVEEQNEQLRLTLSRAEAKTMMLLNTISKEYKRHDRLVQKREWIIEEKHDMYKSLEVLKEEVSSMKDERKRILQDRRRSVYDYDHNGDTGEWVTLLEETVNYDDIPKSF